MQAQVRPAGFWIRVVAYFIDWFFLLLIQIVLWGVGWAVGGGAGSSRAVGAATYLFNWIIGALYFIVFHFRWGQTFGKMLMQIRVVRMDGGPLSLGQAIGRYFATFLSAFILLIGFIMVGLRSDKRALHDLLAGTRVERL
ncbi:MAG TPA: RDD family protein [Methylomirabilota bacterium]|nr:RDD family protein [Methylomirabilota bacterium]